MTVPMIVRGGDLAAAQAAWEREGRPDCGLLWIPGGVSFDDVPDGALEAALIEVLSRPVAATNGEMGPRPWWISDSHRLRILDARGSMVADLTPRSDWGPEPLSDARLRANAEAIVTAVNSARAIQRLVALVSNDAATMAQFEFTWRKGWGRDHPAHRYEVIRPGQPLVGWRFDGIVVGFVPPDQRIAPSLVAWWNEDLLCRVGPDPLWETPECPWRSE